MRHNESGQKQLSRVRRAKDENGRGMSKQGRSLQPANIITGIRILCGVGILFVPAFSAGFYMFYLIGGLSDAIDGTVARKLGQESDFGAKLDTIADFIFAIAVFAKIAGAVQIPLWLIVWAVLIIAVKVINVIIGFVRHGGIVTVHSPLNKICGAVVFLLPLVLGGGFPRQAKAAAAIFACLLATAAAVAECAAIMKIRGEEQ